ITFNSNGGSIVSAITQNYNTDVSTPQNPTKTGYTFGGWYANSELTTAYVFNTMTAGSITIYAKWSINQYTITFDSNGGSIVSVITQDYNTTILTPLSPTKTGYTFGGWYANSELTTAYVFNTMPSENITVFAKWSINQYTITFDSNGGSIVSAITQEYGSPIVAPSNPTKEGYTFNGWSQTIPSVVLPEHMTIFAYWLKVSEPYNGEIQSKTEGIIEAINPFLLENKNAEVIIRFERMQKNEVDQLTISLIESHVDKKQGFSVIDISVIIKTEGSADVKVNELTQKTIITITIPQSDRGYKNYQVVRIHNGQLEALETVYDEQNQTLRFETDRFSNYAIIYETASTNWAWWLLSSLIPIGFVCYHYRNVITVFISKKIKQIHISK
ncbi:MAG: InlB B-repeat-containing protein, partial [Candidatus Izemoplasmatales bacterium]|nr:InlB B-repeat-containing protein [Candidatus Izemoplasmatales bacterium]